MATKKAPFAYKAGARDYRVKVRDAQGNWRESGGVFATRASAQKHCASVMSPVTRDEQIEKQIDAMTDNDARAALKGIAQCLWGDSASPDWSGDTACDVADWLRHYGVDDPAEE